MGRRRINVPLAGRPDEVGRPSWDDAFERPEKPVRASGARIAEGGGVSTSHPRPAGTQGSTSFSSTFEDGKRHGFVASPADPLVEAAVAAVAQRVPEIIRARQEALSQENIDLLVDAYLKSAPTAPARHQIEMDNARERARFLEQFPCYTSREVAGLAGHEAANASATATRWKKAGRIVGLPWKGGDLYPAFQFQEGRPRPILEPLLDILPERMSPWQIAFWLTSSNSWLGGATPLERLDDEAALLAAAERESEALGG